MRVQETVPDLPIGVPTRRPKREANGNLRLLLTVALIVRCFNEEEHIGRLLTGAKRQSRPPDKIILVDSGSTDATLAIAEAFGVDTVSIPPDRFSFGRALNWGIDAAAGYDICVLASAHVYPVYDTWIEHLLAPFARSDVALTYGRQETGATGHYSEARLLSQWFPHVSDDDPGPSVLQQRQRCGPQERLAGPPIR